MVQPALSSLPIFSSSTPCFLAKSIFQFSCSGSPSSSALMEVSLVSLCCEKQQGEEGKVNLFQQLSLLCTVGEEKEEGRERTV